MLNFLQSACSLFICAGVHNTGQPCDLSTINSVKVCTALNTTMQPFCAKYFKIILFKQGILIHIILIHTTFGFNSPLWAFLFHSKSCNRNAQTSVATMAFHTMKNSRVR